MPRSLPPVVSTAKSVQNTSYETKTAKGIYVIVTMTLKNNSGTAQQLFGSDQVVRDSAGWQFSGGKDNENNVFAEGWRRGGHRPTHGQTSTLTSR